MVTPGLRIGPYEILSAIGTGGMGEVYRARDTRLKRDVALKILPESFATDPDRLARFQREAEVLASLSHPNIAAIHGLEESNGTRALVMELVEGETLADHIARGPIPIDEALPIARQVAEALEAAHEKGIIHRDLKPANIKVRADGTVKVLDFGLAKLAEAPTGSAPGPSPESMSPTITSPAMMTGVDVLLGTAAYMSPEQARGKPVDKRTDIWAFGCVLYEMLTGRKAFEADGVADTLAAVLRAEPDLAKLPANLPPSIRLAIERCLEKERKRRIADIHTVKFLIAEHVNLQGVGRVVRTPRERDRGHLVWAAIALVAGAALAGGGAWVMTMRTTVEPAHPMRFIIGAPLNQPTAINPLGDRSIAISPDATHIAYVSNSRQLLIRAMDQLDAVAVPGVTNPLTPFFSPDGRWVGFMTAGELRKVSTGGGPAITICRITGRPMGATWGPNGSIIFATTDGLLTVSADGGGSTVLKKPDRAKGILGYAYPSILPDGRSVLFTIGGQQGSDAQTMQVGMLDLATGEQTTLIRAGTGATYVSPGYVAYFSGNALRVVPFDLRTHRITGDSVTAVDQVASIIGLAGQYAVSQTGTLAYVPSSGIGALYGTRRSLVWVDRSGREEPIPMPPRTYTYPRFSPDGTRVALDIRDQDNDLWIADLARRTLTRLTSDQGTDFYPVWTPDGRRIIFYSNRNGTGNLFWQAADGTGTAERLTTSTTTPHYPHSIAPDGKTVVFQERTPTTAVGLSALVLPSANTFPLLHSAFGETNGEISPDGKWIAYQSNESGQEEIYVRPFPDVDRGRWPISTGGGTRPLWARTGRELFYLDGDNLLTVVSVQTGATFSASTPVRMFTTRYFSGFGGGGQSVAGRTYDISPDGKRFLMIKDNLPADQLQTSIVIVLNWVEELKARVPIK
jgi:eukaryotic-like serine/threonine-protein kinase